MAADEIDVAYVAKLARIALAPGEAERFGAQLHAIFEHVAALAELPTGDVDATAQVIAQRNVTRDDTVVPGLSRDVVLAGAPEREGPYFRVPRILGEPA